MLFDRSDAVPIRSQRIPQSIETPVTFVSAPGAYVRYAYSRSSDSMTSGIEGQDYLSFQHNDQRFVFVICDGVGSSFCGNLAARILGDGLLEWLWSVDITYLGGPAALTEAAASALNRLQKQARYEVEAYEIPGQISPLVRQALEAQRAYGSEAVFAAMRIDHPSPTIPEGLISLCWMGDTQVHVIGEDGGEIAIGGRWENANRWSTTQGVRGQMSAWMRELSGVGRIVAFTDGLAAHAKGVFEYSDDKLDREMRMGARLPTSDDVAVIDVVIRSPQLEGYPDPDLPDLNLERPQLEPIWNPTGAGHYDLRWNWSGEKNSSFMIQEASNPALTDARVMDVITKELTWRPEKPQKPGLYYYRLRAVTRRGTLSPWSELRQTRVAYPPPPAPRLTVDASGGTPELAWDGAGDSLDYVLQEAASKDFEEPKIVYSGRGTSWSPAPGYQPGTYYYRVQALSDGGAGPWSAAQKVTVTLPPPPTPHLVAVNTPYTPDGSSYELRWQPTPGAVYYDVEEANGEDEPVVVRVDEAVYRVSGKPPGEYIYRVRACHDHGCSEWSNEQAMVVTRRAPAEAPAASVEGPDETGALQVMWDTLPDADAYEVEIADEPAFESASLFNQDQPPLIIKRNEPGEMFMRVRGVNDGGPGPWSAVYRSGVAPAAPAWIETALSADGRRVSVSWEAVGGKVVYCLELSTGGEQDYQEVYRGDDTHFEAHIGEQPVIASFRVRAEAGSLSSEWRAADPLQAGPALSAPALTIVQIGAEGEARLRWSEIKGVERYVLEVSRAEHFGSPQKIEGTGTSAAFHPPTSGRYWFRVRAVHGDEAGPPSNIVSIEAERPTTPSLWPLDPMKPNTGFEIAWTGVPGGVYYELQGATSPHFEAEKTSTVRVNHPSQKYAVSGRAPGTYYYRVRAVDAHGQPSLWSSALVVEVRQS